MNNILNNYDAWKLDTPKYSDKYDCEHCDELFDETELNEVTFRDADFDKQTRFVCECCHDSILEGNV
jgi:hypothetical protein